MSEIIVIRHGESEANVGLSTDPNCVLTPRGIEQARVLAARLKEMDLSGFNFLVSPYARARETAGYLAELIGARFEIEPAIREWGKACTIDGIHYREESREELATRIAAFYQRIRGGKYVLVSHAAPISAMIRAAEGQPLKLDEECFWDGIENCCFRRLQEKGNTKS